MKITTPRFLRVSMVILACVTAIFAATVHAAPVKDIVLDRIHAPTAMAAPAAAPAINAVSNINANGDAMVVRLLLESGNGMLKPRPTNTVFNSGDRFRVKMLASREGKVALYNTKPNGELVTEPLWRGDVSRGLEIISPTMRLVGMKGTDQLHIVLEPAQSTGVVSWLGEWLGSKGKDKDIRLDVQNTRSDTYLLGAGDKGLVTTVRISHN